MRNLRRRRFFDDTGKAYEGQHAPSGSSTMQRKLLSTAPPWSHRDAPGQFPRFDTKENAPPPWRPAVGRRCRRLVGACLAGPAGAAAGAAGGCRRFGRRYGRLWSALTLRILVSRQTTAIRRPPRRGSFLGAGQSAVIARCQRGLGPFADR